MLPDTKNPDVGPVRSTSGSRQKSTRYVELCQYFGFLSIDNEQTFGEIVYYKLPS